MADCLGEFARKLPTVSAQNCHDSFVLRENQTSTRLIRQWEGQTHQVTVAEEDFEYKGERYKSLSEIARLITGTRWSGPLFFGLKQSQKNRARA